MLFRRSVGSKGDQEVLACDVCDVSSDGLAGLDGLQKYLAEFRSCDKALMGFWVSLGHTIESAECLTPVGKNSLPSEVSSDSRDSAMESRGTQVLDEYITTCATDEDTVDFPLETYFLGDITRFSSTRESSLASSNFWSSILVDLSRISSPLKSSWGLKSERLFPNYLVIALLTSVTLLYSMVFVYGLLGLGHVERV